jgi:hypothetical protein
MKKIVKLTERDLANIIKKVVKEQGENGTTPQVSTDSNTNQKADFRTIQDNRGKESFLRSLERMVDELKKPITNSPLRKNKSFFGDQLPEFKRQLEILFTEIEGENPSY